MMEIKYDKEADADTFIDYLADGTVKGIEVLTAAHKIFDSNNPFIVYLKNLDAKVIKEKLK